MGKLFNKRVPMVFQIESAECGAAALCMILGYYGKYVNLTDMRRQCRVSRDGSRLSLMMAAARENGLEANAYRAPADYIKYQLPAIIFWRAYHFVVLERLTDKWAYICDPGLGRRKVSLEEFRESYSGIICELKPTEKFEKSGKPFRSGEYVLKMLMEQRNSIIILSILYLLVNIVGMIMQGMSRLFVDYYLPSLGTIKMSTFFTVYAFLIAVQFLMLALRIGIVNHFYRIESTNINESVIKKLLRLPTAFFQSRSHSKIVTKLNSIDSLSDYMSAKLVPLTMGIVFSVQYACLLFYYSPLIGFVTIAIIAVVLIIMQRMLMWIRNTNMTMINEQMDFYAGTQQTFRLFSTIKSIAGEKDNLRDNMRAYNSYESALQHSKSAGTILTAIPVVVPLIIQTEVICIGTSLAIKGDISIGIVLACQGIAVSIFAPLAEFISNYSMIQEQNINIMGLKDIEDEKPDSLFSREGGIEKDRLSGRVELRDVAFGYNTSIPNIIEDINVVIEQGKSLAFVGGSGAGKTTIVRLLVGLYEPISGGVLFDGLPIKEISRDTMAKSVAIVSQQASVFNGTVRENIALFDSSIPMEVVKEAAEAACIYDEIEAHEGGFNAMLNEQGTGFSGGQIQRMMIARALVRRPSILIMDEATSALDPLIEEEVMNNIKKLGITMIIVAHRLSTIRDCNEIVVLDKGRIIERGTHEELMGDSGSYYKDLVKTMREGA